MLSRKGIFRFPFILAAGVLLILALFGLWFGSTFYLDSPPGQRSLVERLSELGKPPEPEQPPTIDEPEEPPQISMGPPAVVVPPLSGDPDSASEKEGPGEKTKITISPIEINE